MEIGDSREKFCEDCEAVTTQRLDKLLGSGEHALQEWFCLDGGHVFGKHPSDHPPLDEPHA